MNDELTPLKKAILNEKRNGNYGNHYEDGNGRKRSKAEIFRIEQSQAADQAKKAKDKQIAAEESAKRRQDNHNAYEQKRYEREVFTDDEWQEKYGESMYEEYDGIRKDYDAVDNKDIKTIIDAVKDIEYGYIDINDDHRETNRDYIHGFAKRTDDNLLNHYRLEVNPINTLVHKIGICGDQTICIKYLINSILDGYECHGYALRKGRFGHAVPGFKTPTGEWYYLENAWDKERGLHGPFKSEEELMDYFDYLYHKHHDKDNDDPVTVERWNCLMEELYCDVPLEFELLNESVESRKMFADYNEYLKQHIGNVKKGFDWIKQYCPEMLEKVKVGKVESLIRVHDRSKYSRAEYEPYAQYFYGDKAKWTEAFDKACQHHYKHNKHHPEFWHGTYMPEEYIIEMICDWWSFSWKENKLGNIFNFFYNKKDEFEKKIHPQSFARLQELLKMLRKKLNKLDLI